MPDDLDTLLTEYARHLAGTLRTVTDNEAKRFKETINRKPTPTRNTPRCATCGSALRRRNT